MLIICLKNNPLNKPVYILAIESSCDDTSAAILKDKTVLSNLIANQEVHEKYGGVVPELASRAHQSNILPVVKAALSDANVKLEDLNAIAYTKGPGLLGSLLVGSSFAKGLAWSLGIPLIEVNHMQAHILAHLIEQDNEPIPPFPFICLTVSGGHTQLVLVKSSAHFEIIGQTLDDAVGEAFDKIAKLLGLPYPGGPMIDKYAREGNPDAFTFSKSKVGEFEFSFSGIKTSVLYFLQKEIKKNPEFINKNLKDLCASVQKHLVSVLIDKLKLAEKKYQTKHIAIAGGVSANSLLRSSLTQLEEELDVKSYCPNFEYCTDNAAMIGIVGYYGFLNKQFAPLTSTPKARLAL